VDLACLAARCEDFGGLGHPEIDCWHVPKLTRAPCAIIGPPLSSAVELGQSRQRLRDPSADRAREGGTALLERDGVDDVGVDQQRAHPAENDDHN
jgi:hypothetical protein